MTIIDYIRSMETLELAEFLLDIAEENSAGSHESLRIPSPFGGYLCEDLLYNDSDTLACFLLEDIPEGAADGEN